MILSVNPDPSSMHKIPFAPEPHTFCFRRLHSVHDIWGRLLCLGAVALGVAVVSSIMGSRRYIAVDGRENAVFSLRRVVSMFFIVDANT